MRMKSKTQHTNSTGIKRKIGLESEAKLGKVKSSCRKNNAPLKGELILELKGLKERYLALEEKSKGDIKRLEDENIMLKDKNKKFSEEVKCLKQIVQNLETEKINQEQRAQNFICYNCSFKAS